MPQRPTTWRERLGALRNLPPFLAMVWRTSWPLTATTLGVRLVRALLPVATLFVGKLIIDEVVHLTHLVDRTTGLSAWLASGLLDCLEALLLAKFALAVGPTSSAGSCRWWTGCCPTGSATTPAFG